MAMRIRGAAGLAAIAALALLLELAALFVLGPRLVAQIQRSAPQEWVTAADVTGRALTHAVAAAETHAMAATARAAFGARNPVDRALVVATSRSCGSRGSCRVEVLRLRRSTL